MLRLLVILLIFTTVAFATSQNAWKEGKEYTYKVRSRTLAAVNSQSKQYSGILMKAHLTVQPNGQDTLRAKVQQPLYSKVHTRLENGWESEIPDDKTSWINVPLSEEPFEIKMKNGVVQELIVDNNVPTWEVNILKSIVSQLQVDVQGQNAMKSKQNHLPEGKQPFASFKTMEDSVGGKCEVLYDVSPLSEQILQSKPELAPLPQLREDGEMISLVKTKNFSHCSHRVSYHSGVNGRNKFEPGDNDNGKYLSRSSVSRIVISGNLEKFTIQSSVTNNKVVLNPDQQENQQGMVVSKVNVTLIHRKDVSEQLSAPSKPQSVGNLVYNYNNPFESSSSRRPNKVNKNKNSNEDENSNESRSSSMQSNNDDSYLQLKPTLSEAPRNPMLSFFVGNNGNSIQKDQAVDAIKSTKDIAQQIGNELLKPNNMLKEQTLEKFTILIRLIRTMNAQQIDEAQRELYEPLNSSNQLNEDNQNQRSRRYAWVAFLDAVSNSGTGPALVNIKQWIQRKKIQNTEAAVVIDTLAQSALIPNPDFIDALFEIVTMPETKEQPQLRDASIMALADLSRHAIVNKRSAHNRYPVHVFGRLFSKNNQNLHQKYIPHIIEELKAAIKSGDSKKIQVYTVALGKIGHPRILSVFEPYIEGRKEISPFQRLVMVMSLEKLASTYPKVAQSIFYKIYSNNADNHEIRCAAVFMLMKTNPSSSILQRMAESTNFESSRHVNSAVKSSIESLAQLESDETRKISDAAKAALPLLNPEKFGIQYSRAVFKNIKNPQTHSGLSIEAKMIGSDDSIIPKGVFITISPVVNGLKLPKVRMGGATSTVQDVWNFLDKQLGINKKKSNSEAKNKPFSPENIAKLLKIQGDDPKQIEGFVNINEKSLGNYFLAFDNHSLAQLPLKLNELDQVMSQGINLDKTKFNSHEVTISFPTETGYPLSFTLKIPTVIGVKVNANAKSEYDSDERTPLPKSSKINNKVRLVYGLKIQKRIGFVVPFERQEFIAGVDRNIHLFLPLRSQIDYDTSKADYRVKIQVDNNSQMDESEKQIKIAQVQILPFTSNHNILSLKPVSTDKNTHILNKDRVSTSKVEYKDENNEQRLQLEWEIQSDDSFEDKRFKSDHEKLFIGSMKLARSVGSLIANTDPVNTRYEKYSIKVSPSDNMNVEIQVSCDGLESKNDNDNDNDNNNHKLNATAPSLDNNLSESERKQKLLEEVSKNINSAQSAVIDVSFRVNGVMQTSAGITAAVSISEVDKKSRILALGRAKIMSGNEYHGSIGIESKIVDPETFDFEETLKANTGNEYEAAIHYGTGSDEKNSNEQHHTIKIKVSEKQSEERKEEIRRSREAQMCAKQMSEKGNKMIASCHKLNRDAAMLNKADIDISFEDESPLREVVMTSINSIEKMAQMLRQTQKNYQYKMENNKIKIYLEMFPRKKEIDMAIKTSEGEMEVQYNDVMIFDEEDDESNENIQDKQNNNYDPTKLNSCSLDKTEIKTFDKKRYSVELGHCWHVAMTSYPKNDPDRQNQQIDVPENMQASILVREIVKGQKEVKITLGGVEVKLTHDADGKYKSKAEVNGKLTKLSKKKSYQERMNGVLLFEMFRRSDDSIKLVSDEYNIIVVYDGTRILIKAGERYRKAIRGLCGNNDSEPENDQQTPYGCQLQKPEEFAATWALVTDATCQGPARKNAEKAKRSPCTRESARSGNVISDEEANYESWRSDSRESDNDWNKSNQQNGKHCMHHRTKVEKSDDQICFSTRPIPVCSSKCKSTSMTTKKIDMHCVARSSAAERVAQRVEAGANPDLTQKFISKSISQQVPVHCGV